MSKYFFAVVLVMALTFSSLGCGQQPSSPPQDTPPEITISPEGSEAKLEEATEAMPMEGTEAMPMEGSEAKPMEGSETK